MYSDVLGLCKAATLEEVELQGWSLSPGRYVGVAPGEEIDFEELGIQFSMLNEELENLNIQAESLQK
jgi:type I restriction enzyme M protein